ncbi:MAG: DUF2306 domain-containing protein [Planctomycetes bacterium]|nr:DUF2306 domain-containing protein [Planctomycetota bacterium]
MIHNEIGLVHVISAVVALLVGLWIFLRPKGGTLHRVLGYVYVVSMFAMIITAFLIYQLTGSINLLHGFAVVSTIQLGRGLYHAISRRPKGAWLDAHYRWISYSYMGLCAALVAESATRVVMPYLHDYHGIRSFGWFWVIVGIVSFAVVYVGLFLMQRNRERLTGYRSPS